MAYAAVNKISSSVLSEGVTVSFMNLQIRDLFDLKFRNLSKSFSSGPSEQNFVYAGIDVSVKLSRFENGIIPIGSPSPPE